MSEEKQKRRYKVPCVEFRSENLTSEFLISNKSDIQRIDITIGKPELEETNKQVYFYSLNTAGRLMRIDEYKAEDVEDNIKNIMAGISLVGARSVILSSNLPKTQAVNLDKSVGLFAQAFDLNYLDHVTSGYEYKRGEISFYDLMESNYVDNSKIDLHNKKYINSMLELKEKDNIKVEAGKNKLVNLTKELSKQLYEKPYEALALVCLDKKNKPINYSYISEGAKDSSVIDANKLFNVAILSEADNILLLHNHPSGSNVASYDDKSLTKRIYRAGEVLGINLLEHLIVGESMNFILDEMKDSRYQSKLSSEIKDSILEEHLKNVNKPVMENKINNLLNRHTDDIEF